MALNVMMTSARVEETPVKMEVLFRTSHPQTITLQCSFVERQPFSLELKSPPRLVVKTRATLPEVLFRNSHPQTITLQCSFVERQAISLELKSPPRLVVKTRATLRYKSGNIQSRDTFRPIVRSH